MGVSLSFTLFFHERNSKDGDSVLTFTVMNMLILMCQKNNYPIYDNFFLDLVDATTLKKC